MRDLLTSTELMLFRKVPQSDLVDLAIELGIAVDEVTTVDGLLSLIVVRLGQLARREGLPLSHYDREDLVKLGSDERRALARLCGAPADIDGLIKAGERVYRAYDRRGPSKVALFLPLLLQPLARHALLTEDVR